MSVRCHVFGFAFLYVPVTNSMLVLAHSVRCRCWMWRSRLLVRWYGLMVGHDGNICMSCSSAKSFICFSVGRSFLWATRRWAMHWDFVAAVVGGFIVSLQ